MDYPFLDPRFLAALEESGSASPATGWTPCHLALDLPEGKGFLPLYLKDHSFGEYVFDWGWAQAAQRAGIRYYPKLVCAIPFTPVPGPRVRLARGDLGEVGRRLVEEALALCRAWGASGFHLLFPDAPQQEALAAPPLLRRRGLQYHWFNRGYGDFEDFLARLKSNRRKSIRRERRAVAEARLEVRRHIGAELDDAAWRAFERCYRRTYERRSGFAGYLTGDFFARLRRDFAEQILMVTAARGGELIACALFFFDQRALYGRWWGCLEDWEFLHFELCYYQGIEFAIERGLARFEAGAQGEHKLLRGFEPVFTHSLHWLAQRELHRTVAAFLDRENTRLQWAWQRARELLPYRADALEESPP